MSAGDDTRDALPKRVESLLQLGDVTRFFDLVTAELAEKGGVREALHGTLEPFVKARGWMFVLSAVAVVAAAELHADEGGTQSDGFQAFLDQAEVVRQGCLQNPAPDQLHDLRQMLAIFYGMATFWRAVEMATDARAHSVTDGLHS